MKCLAYLSGDQNFASSRIRFYRTLKYLEKKEIYFDIYQGTVKQKINAFSSWIKFYDCLYVQKRCDGKVIALCKQFIERKKPVIYDVDVAIADMTPHQEWVLKYCSAVIVNTNTCCEIVRKKNKRVYVIQDAIDYADKKKRVKIKENIDTVGTFFGSNINYVNWTKQYMNKLHSINKVYITGKKGAGINGNFVRWSLQSFSNELRKFDICILIHPESEYGNLKSTNRLTTAMAFGIPCLVSNTSSYVKIIEDVGYKKQLVVNSPDEIQMKFNLLKFNFKLREEISKKFFDYAWKYFAPEKIADDVANVFKGVVK